MSNKAKPNTKYHIIYKTTNTIDNKFYIGKHSTNDLNDEYFGSGKHLSRAIKKYGKENFSRETLHIFYNEQEALLKEKEIVTEELIKNKNCYNQVLGGDGSWFHVKDLIPCISDYGVKYMISKDEFNTGNHKGINKGKLIVYDKDGKSYHVNKNDPRISSGELVPFSKGRIHVIDNLGNHIHVSIMDPRYLSGELVPFSKGKIPVVDKDGKRITVDKNDPRYLSGELVPFSKGKVTVKDKGGNTFSVLTSDPRYISGELVHINSGRKRNKTI